MTDVARFNVAPKMRCCHFDPKKGSSICGELASWKAADPHLRTSAFFCDEHHRPTDVAIAGPVLFRRVSFQLEVQLAGVSPLPALAQAEALARLERAVEQAGGLLGVVSASSVVGMYDPPAPLVRNPGGRYKGK